MELAAGQTWQHDTPQLLPPLHAPGGFAPRSAIDKSGIPTLCLVVVLVVVVGWWWVRTATPLIMAAVDRDAERGAAAALMAALGALYEAEAALSDLSRPEAHEVLAARL